VVQRLTSQAEAGQDIEVTVTRATSHKSSPPEDSWVWPQRYSRRRPRATGVSPSLSGIAGMRTRIPDHDPMRFDRFMISPLGSRVISVQPAAADVAMQARPALRPTLPFRSGSRSKTNRCGGCLSVPRSAAGSESPVRDQKRGDRHDQNLDVEGQRPIVRIISVTGDTLAVRRVAAATDLP